MIRRADIADYPAFVSLVARFRERLETYPNCPVDPDSVAQTFRRCVSSPSNLALVAEHEGGITGALLAVTQELWWSKSREATDAMIYAEQAGDGFRMARQYVQWAQANHRVAVITLAHSSGGDLEESGRLHRLLGLTPIGLISQGVNPMFGAKREAAA